jgi:formylglycine-generating enzyme required for sulfatase activity
LSVRVAAFVLAAALALPASSSAAEYARIGGGSFASVLPPDGKSAPAAVASFRLRTLPITNGEFLAFVRAHPQWRRDDVASIFADDQYLAHWTGALQLRDDQRQQPVTHVSWFAAAAFCESEHARLPSWYEFEFAAAADETRADARGDPAWRERILDWYARPSTAALPDVGGSAANVYGIHDMHGLVWEWVSDYASLMVSGDNRDQGDPDLLKFCGAGALSTQDRENYAVLMRIALLSSLKAADTTANLGFRCAMDDHP